MYEDLYYTDPENAKETYVNDGAGAGTPSIQRLFDGEQDIFAKQEIIPSEKKKKKIIVTDWLLWLAYDKDSYNVYTKKFTETVEKVRSLMYLMKEGFEVYGHINGELRRISEPQEFLTIQYAPNSQIIELAGKLGMTQNQIYLSGFFDKVIPGKSFQVEHRPSHYLFDDKISQEFKETNTSELKLEGIVRQYHNDYKSKFQGLYKPDFNRADYFLESIKETQGYYYITPELKNCGQIYLNENIVNKEVIQIITQKFSKNLILDFIVNIPLPPVEPINPTEQEKEMYNYQKFDYIKDLKNKKTQIFNLENDKIANDKITKINIKFPGYYGDKYKGNIKELELYKLKKAQMKSLIEGSTNLKSISLNNLAKEIDGFLTDMILPQSLEDIELTGYNSFLDLVSIQKNLSNIKNITISELKDEDDKYPNITIYNNFKFPDSLEKLSLRNIQTSLKYLSDSLSNCKNLKRLQLVDFNILELDEDIKLPDSLEVLDLCRIETNIEKFNKLIASSKNIKKIVIGYSVAGIGDGIEKKIIIPENIEIIEYGGYAIKPRDFMECMNSGMKSSLSGRKDLDSQIAIFKEGQKKITNSFLDKVKEQERLKKEAKELAEKAMLENQDKGDNPQKSAIYDEKAVKELKELLNTYRAKFNIQSSNTRSSAKKKFDFGGRKAPRRSADSQIEQKSIDSNTLSEGAEVNEYEYFKPKVIESLHPSEYRLEVYDKVDETGKPIGVNPKDLKDVAVEVKENISEEYKKYENEKNGIFYGVMEFDKAGTYVLPSIARDDKIIGIKVNPKDANYKVKYSESRGLYYIETDKAISVGYMLKNKSRAARYAVDKVPDIESNDFKKLLEEKEKILSLIKYFTDFKQEKLSKEFSSSKETFEAIIKERKGACRHMARGFVYMAHQLGIKTARLIANDCHEMVEVFLDGQYQTVNLGGAPSIENKKEFKDIMEEKTPDNPKSKDDKSPKKEKIDPKKPEDKEGKKEKTEPKQAEAKDEITAEDMKENPFKFWERNTSSATTMEQYAKELIDEGNKLYAGKKNILCVIEKDKIEALHNELMRQEKGNVYFISNLDRVLLKDPVIDDKGIYEPKDSKLAEFIKQGNGVLLVDWSKYKAEHVGYNSMMDLRRRIKELEINHNIKVVSILDNQYAAGEDFYSRHGYVTKAPNNLTVTPPEHKEASGETLEIEFYSDSWRQEIFGNIAVSENGYEYKESELISKIKTAKDVKLINAPWNTDREFRVAISEIMAQKKVRANGQDYDCPNINFIIQENKDYVLDELKLEDYDAKGKYEVVNKINFNSLFSRYEIGADHKIKPIGLDKDVKLLVTQNLTNGQWKKLSKLNKEITIAEGVSNPIKKDIASKKAEPKNISVTNDLDLYKESHQKEYDLVIEINKATKFSDLVESIKYDHKTKEFTHQESVLTKDLKAGKNILLLGNPSPELSKQLESLFLDAPYLMINGKRIDAEIKGKIKLVTDKSNAISIVKDKELDAFTEEAMWKEAIKKVKPKLDSAKLFEEMKKLKAYNIKFNYTQMVSILKRREIKPLSNPFKHVLRLRKDYKDIKEHLEKAFPKNKKVKPGREQKIINELNNNRYVFVIGSSGVGKSRMVHEELSKKYQVLEGMPSLGEFIKPAGDGDTKKLLFLDEANITATPEMYEVFRPFLRGENAILVNGELVPLSDKHHIIFAGNFRHFEGRVDIKLVNDYGSIVEIKDLKEQEIKEQVTFPILESLFKDVGITVEQKEKAAKVIYKVYSKLNENSAEEKVLTIRNIQMMLMRYKGLFDKTKKDHESALAIAIYDEVSPLLDKETRNEFKKELLYKASELGFNEGKVKGAKNQLKSEVGDKIGDLVVTKSRKNLVRQLDALLESRDLADKGIKGVLVEGEPGIGKSTVAVEYLKEKGFVNGDENPDAENKYYVISPTSFQEAKEKLEKAFKEGAMVIIDEINTMQLEAVLNPMLSGVGLDGKPSEKKGFTVIGTQNPISFKGRNKLSNALMKRFTKIELPSYKPEELQQILEKSKELTPEEAKNVTEAYTDSIKYALKNNLSLPTVRDFLKNVSKENVDKSGKFLTKKRQRIKLEEENKKAKIAAAEEEKEKLKKSKEKQVKKPKIGANTSGSIEEIKNETDSSGEGKAIGDSSNTSGISKPVVNNGSSETHEGKDSKINNSVENEDNGTEENIQDTETNTDSSSEGKTTGDSTIPSSDTISSISNVPSSKGTNSAKSAGNKESKTDLKKKEDQKKKEENNIEIPESLYIDLMSTYNQYLFANKETRSRLIDDVKSNFTELKHKNFIDDVSREIDNEIIRHGYDKTSKHNIPILGLSALGGIMSFVGLVLLISTNPNIINAISKSHILSNGLKKLIDLSQLLSKDRKMLGALGIISGSIIGVSFGIANHAISNAKRNSNAEKFIAKCREISTKQRNLHNSLINPI